MRVPPKVQQICNDIVAEIYAGKYTEIYSAAAREYVARAKAEGARFTALSDAEKQQGNAAGARRPAEERGQRQKSAVSVKRK